MNFFKAIKDRIQGKAMIGQRRSGDWPTARKLHLKENPKCEVCESKFKTEVHHIIPFSIAPDLETNPDNMMTLCENKKYGINCHLLIGHLGNYRRTNPSCELDAMAWRFKIKG